MLKSISLELVYAISNRMMLYANDEKYSIMDDAGDLICLINFENLFEQHLIDECIEWRRIIDTYFKTSYRAMSLKRAGRYLNVRPLPIQKPKTKDRLLHITPIKFQIEFVDQKNWKEWFVMKGELNAP